jgi:glycosyltransferase involved in cell wall biosynthesis
MCNFAARLDKVSPTVSVVTPSFRQLDWLKLCLASVADQKGVWIEHIIQDGGSDEEITQLCANKPHVQLFRDSDDGMYDALNRGFQRARGRILAWLNCDEQYLPGTLAKVAAYFEAHPEVEMLFGDIILVDREGAPLSYRRVVPPNRVHLRLEHLCTPSCATFFRREIIERGAYFDTQWKSLGDAVWMHSLLGKGVRTACLREPLSVYTFTGVNLSETRGEREMEEWRKQSDAPPSWLRLPAMVWHRFRKLLAGAYHSRDLHYAIFTHRSPRVRVSFDVPKVGFGWPGVTAPPAPAKADF